MAAFKECVRHAGICLAAVGFASSVSCRHGAELKSGCKVGKSRNKHAVLNYLCVAGKHAVVVKEIGGSAQRSRRAVTHICYRRRHILTYAVSRKRAVLHELVHFNAVTERLVCDESGYRAVCYHIINARLDRRCVRKMQRLIYKAVGESGHSVHHIGKEVRVDAIACLRHPAILGYNDHVAVRPAVMLGKLAVLGYEQLGCGVGLYDHDGIQNALVLGEQLIAQTRAEGKNILVGVIFKIRFAYKIAYERLVGGERRFYHAAVKRGIGLYFADDFFGKCGRIAGGIVERIFKERSTVVKSQHKSAFAFAVTYSGRTAVGAVGSRMHIGAEYADITEGFAQLGDECTACRTSFIKIIGKRHFGTPFIFFHVYFSTLFCFFQH